VNLDSARQSKIEAKCSDRRSPVPSGQDEKKARFGKATTNPNSQNLTKRGIFVFFLFFFCFPNASFAFFSVEEMTLEEKVGQILLVHVNGEEANDEAALLVQNIHVGGFIYYNWANGLTSPSQVFHLSRGLQKLAEQSRLPIPLFIAIDQEGGLIARLEKGFTVFPGNKALAQTENLQLAEECAFIMGQELSAVGINFNLSPVVDINSNPRNPVIGIRSFGETPQVVFSFAKNVLNGHKKAGIISCLKHFPGHGDIAVDSHEDLPLVKKTKEQLKKHELVPFTQLASEADAVMTAHLMIPALDAQRCATLSKTILTLLKEEMGFKGVIISDSLVMEGLLKNCSSIEEAAIEAFNAGCDIVMLGGKQLIGAHQNLELKVNDIQNIHRVLIQAVKNGRISEEKLNQSVQKILELKNRVLLSHTQLSEDEAMQRINTFEHQQLAKKIAVKALRFQNEQSPFLPILKYSHLMICAPALMQSLITQTHFPHLGSTNTFFFFEGFNPSKEEMITAQESSKPADILIFFSYNAWKNPSQISLIRSLLQTNKPFILICLRDPLDADLCGDADVTITSFSPSLVSIQATCDFLENNTFSIPSEIAHQIGEKIWKNECKGSFEGLTHWNQGEGFASMGIGHFIWYQKGQKEHFEETFPDLLIFLENKGKAPPHWLKSHQGCPWKSKEEFYHDFQSPDMQSLRKFLFDTKDLQAIFIAKRLEQSLPLMIKNLTKEEKVRILSLFYRLAEDPKGLYALLDYSNFKGLGTSPTETYQGQGWGLLQVLQTIPASSQHPLYDFVAGAKKILAQRVHLSPPERYEQQWLQGWINRVVSYLN